jgi:predicted secreted protein
MAKRNIRAVLVLIVLLSVISACSGSEGGRQEAVFKQVAEIAEIRPGSPVKIKLKRNGDGDYSWELSGDDAEKVLLADKKLKESLGKANSR